FGWAWLLLSTSSKKLHLLVEKSSQFCPHLRDSVAFHRELASRGSARKRVLGGAEKWHPAIPSDFAENWILVLFSGAGPGTIVPPRALRDLGCATKDPAGHWEALLPGSLPALGRKPA